MIIGSHFQIVVLKKEKIFFHNIPNKERKFLHEKGKKSLTVYD